MHIVIITGPFQPVPPAPGGAVERMWQELAEEFSAKGHTVTFLCRTHPVQGANETIRGVRYVRRMQWLRSSNLYKDLIKDLLYSFRMIAHIPPADIVITNTFWLPILLTAFRRPSIKTVVNVNRMPKGQMGWYRNVDRLIAVSNAIREKISAQCPEVIPIVRLIPNPIDTNIFTPSPNVRSYDGTLTILYAGRVHPEKGVHLLIEAFRKLSGASSNVQLRILGPTQITLGGGGPEYLAKLQSSASGLSVEFSPPTFDKQELAKAYQAAHVFCYPSLAEKGESFGLAPLEAMATGLVPVVSNLACFQDFVIDEVNGLVFDHRDSSAATLLAEKLNSLLCDPSKTARMGEEAAEQALLFGRERVAKQYLSDFSELLSSTPAQNTD